MSVMAEIGWRDAIIQVLRNSSEPMHYADIAEKIAEQALRSDFGATPASTVNAIISVSLQKEGEYSPFIRVAKRSGVKSALGSSLGLMTSGDG